MMAFQIIFYYFFWNIKILLKGSTWHKKYTRKQGKKQTRKPKQGKGKNPTEQNQTPETNNKTLPPWKTNQWYRDPFVKQAWRRICSPNPPPPRWSLHFLNKTSRISHPIIKNYLVPMFPNRPNDGVPNYLLFKL
jgi:hypothetical protein